MMYLLTQAEYDKLTYTKEAKSKLSDKKLQELCTRIADTMPINCNFPKQKDRPWGCKITAENLHGNEWYCDNCPVQEICPHEDKEYSK